MFRSYLLGYLNEYHCYKTYFATFDDKSYKEFKIKRMLNYLKIPPNFTNLFSKGIQLLSIVEIPISLTILLYNFIKCYVILLCTPSIKIQHAKLMLGLNYDKIPFINMTKSVDLTYENITIIKIPTVSTNYDDYKTISIFSGLKFKDIVKAYAYALKMVFFIKKKYHKRDLLFRSYSSFEYFLCYFFVTKSDQTNEYYFEALYDRWANLFGSIEHKTYLIQHGILDDRVKFKKVGKVDFAYYIDKKQKEICENILFKNIPVAYYRKPINLDSTEKLLKNGFKNILLICNLIFFDKEKEIVKNLKDKKVNLYVKPHPKDNKVRYENLQLNNKFILLEKGDYLKVDIVISYISTLATEYENNGILVLRHTDKSFQDDYDKTFEVNN